MRRIACLVVVCSAGPVGAETRLHVGPIPDLSIIEHMFVLDRYGPRDRSDWCGTGRTGKTGSLTLGAGIDSDFVGSASLAAGTNGDQALALGVSSELIGGADELVRGRHRALARFRAGDDDDFGVKLELGGALDHGKAPGLAPIAQGAGRRLIGSTRGRALIQLGKERNDFVWAASVDGELGVMRWWESPLDGGNKRSLGMGIGRAPVDGELPSGNIEVLRGRVERVSIDQPIAAAGSTGVQSRTDVRIVEIGLGPKEMTFHIDREFLAVLDVDLGWSWLEAGDLSDNMFRMKLSGSAIIAEKRDRLHRIGVAISRDPTHTPDGSRIVSETRITLATGTERRKYLLEARGGLSWTTAHEGGPAVGTLLRYGTQLEAFAKLGHGLELGGYYAGWFEPQTAGDPWASPRRWTREAGLALRFRRASR